MEASRLERRTRMLQICRYTLNANYSQLLDTDKHFRNNQPKWVTEDEKTIRKFQLEYSRQLHNYISSYYSLYEHTQTIANHIENKSLSDGYDRKLEDLNIKTVSTFLLRLRAYIQHYQIVPVDLESSYDFLEQIGDAKLYISRGKLLEWDSWNDAEEYVQELDEEIEVITLFEDIHESVNNFGDWFIEALQK